MEGQLWQQKEKATRIFAIHKVSFFCFPLLVTAESCQPLLPALSAYLNGQLHSPFTIAYHQSLKDAQFLFSS